MNLMAVQSSYSSAASHCVNEVKVARTGDSAGKLISNNSPIYTQPLPVPSGGVDIAIASLSKLLILLFCVVLTENSLIDLLMQIARIARSNSVGCIHETIKIHST